MITPEILPNNSRGVTPNLPRIPERFMEPLPENEDAADAAAGVPAAGRRRRAGAGRGDSGSRRRIRARSRPPPRCRR